jgi:TRAP-type uncharacterized transport system fused permease subunit
MFIFYYAVLSEVSPPTALSPFAAAALTGGNPFATMIRTWKYTLPAFVVPFVFTLGDRGTGLLMRGDVRDMLTAALSSSAGIAALAAVFTGRIRGPLGTIQRLVLAAAGVLFLYGSLASVLVASATAGLVLILQFRGHSRRAGREGSR